MNGYSLRSYDILKFITSFGTGLYKLTVVYEDLTEGKNGKAQNPRLFLS